MSFVAGDGQRIKFWRDIWCGDSPLCVAFPSFFSLACTKDDWVGDVWSKSEDVGILLSSSCSMIERWRMLRDFCFF